MSCCCGGNAESLDRNRATRENVFGKGHFFYLCVYPLLPVQSCKNTVHVYCLQYLEIKIRLANDGALLMP